MPRRSVPSRPRTPPWQDIIGGAEVPTQRRCPPPQAPCPPPQETCPPPQAPCPEPQPNFARGRRVSCRPRTPPWHEKIGADPCAPTQAPCPPPQAPCPPPQAPCPPPQAPCPEPQPNFARGRRGSCRPRTPPWHEKIGADPCAPTQAPCPPPQAPCPPPQAPCPEPQPNFARGRRGSCRPRTPPWHEKIGADPCAPTQAPCPPPQAPCPPPQAPCPEPQPNFARGRRGSCRPRTPPWYEKIGADACPEPQPNFARGRRRSCRPTTPPWHEKIGGEPCPPPQAPCPPPQAPCPPPQAPCPPPQEPCPEPQAPCPVAEGPAADVARIDQALGDLEEVAEEVEEVQDMVEEAQEMVSQAIEAPFFSPPQGTARYHQQFPSTGRDDLMDIVCPLDMDVSLTGGLEPLAPMRPALCPEEDADRINRTIGDLEAVTDEVEEAQDMVEEAQEMVEEAQEMVSQTLDEAPFFSPPPQEPVMYPQQFRSRRRAELISLEEDEPCPFGGSPGPEELFEGWDPLGPRRTPRRQRELMAFEGKAMGSPRDPFCDVDEDQWIGWDVMAPSRQPCQEPELISLGDAEEEVCPPPDPFGGSPHALRGMAPLMPQPAPPYGQMIYFDEGERNVCQPTSCDPFGDIQEDPGWEPLQPQDAPFPGQRLISLEDEPAQCAPQTNCPFGDFPEDLGWEPLRPQPADQNLISFEERAPPQRVASPVAFFDNTIRPQYVGRPSLYPYSYPEDQGRYSPPPCPFDIPPSCPAVQPRDVCEEFDPLFN